MCCLFLPKGFSFGRLHYCSVFYNKGVYLYIFLTAIIFPAAWLLTFYGSIIGVNVHRQRKENACVAPDPADGGASVQSTMEKVQAARRQRRAIRVATTCAVVNILFLACWLPVWIISPQLVFRLGQVPKRSQFDDRVLSSSFLDELSSIFHHGRTLLLFLSACHLSEDGLRR